MSRRGDSEFLISQGLQSMLTGGEATDSGIVLAPDASREEILAAQDKAAEMLAKLEGGDDASSDEIVYYNDHTKAELVAEIERRNDERGEDVEPLVSSGTKAELVAVLEADDAQ